MLHRTKQFKLFVLGLIFVAIPVRGAEIHDAAKNGDIEKVKSLLTEKSERMNAKDKNGYTPLHWATTEGHKELTGLLRRHGGH